jgi:hypothetical protein
MPHTPENGEQRFPSDRRERAKAMFAAGVFGGAGRGQGRKPKAHTTAGEQVAELALEEASAIKQTYRTALRDANPRTRLAAARQLLLAEERERQRRELAGMQGNEWTEEELLRLPREELNLILVERLIELVGEYGHLPATVRGQLAQHDPEFPDVIEAGAREILGMSRPSSLSSALAQDPFSR